MSDPAVETRERVRRRLHALGFDVVRFAAIGPWRDRGLRAWLAAEHHADMAWMERTADQREHPDRVLPGAQTVVVLGVNCWPDEPRAMAGGVWARYALYRDYHETIQAALEDAGRVVGEECALRPGDCRWYVDTGPVMERGWAATAGAGFRGKNGMLISRDFGNWLLLAAMLVRAPLPPDESRAARHPAAFAAGEADWGTETGLLCGKCTRCLDACPTAAFPHPGIVDARRCLSYHTIENKGILPREFRSRLGARLFGCDVCLEVCPWNRFARAGRSLLLERRFDLAALPLLEVLRLTPERFREVFRGTAIKRLKLAGLLRNACIVAGNVWRAGGPEPGTVVPPGFAEPAEGPAAATELLRLAGHESPIVRAAAVWAGQRVLGAGPAAELLAARRAVEPDPAVRAEFD